MSPNVVFLIADDQGFRDYGFMGSEIVETPNLDQLALEGVVFENARTTSSVCSPSLRTLLTGLHPIQFDHRGLQLALDGRIGKPGDAIRQMETLPRCSRQGRPPITPVDASVLANDKPFH